MNRISTVCLCVVSILVLSNCSVLNRIQADKSYQGLPQKISGEWILTVDDMMGQNLFVMNIRFTTVPAESCIGDNWMKILRLSYKPSIDNSSTYNNVYSYHQAEVESPLLNELSYKFADNKLVIGRNILCDAYLRMSGELSQLTIGDYYVFGIESSKELGSFILTKVEKQ